MENLKNIKSYQSHALLEMLKICVAQKKLERFIPEIEQEILSRFGAHEINAKHFSKFGITPELTKTLEDFLKEIDPTNSV
jgi:hypothetical protein